MKKSLLLLVIVASSFSLRAQSLAWTSWIDIDTATNAPGLYWQFTADSVRYSWDNVIWDVVSGYTYVPNVYSMIDDPAAGCATITDTGRYTTVFSADTMWLNLIGDPCSERADYLSAHYFLRLNTGIQEESMDNQFSIFPNPTSGIFTIDASAAAKEIVITDVTGRVIEKDEYSGSTTIDLSNSPAGIYFVTVTFENGNVTQRVIVD